MPALRRAPFTLKRVGTRLYSATAPTGTAAGKLTIGIRREDPLRIWERRCPLTPDAVRDLVRNEGVEVLVQPCERRVWSTREFVEAGAKPHPTLAPAHILVGIKETPLKEVLTDLVPSPRDSSPMPRTHLMFSHTHKGQMYNMELLSKFLCPSALRDCAAERPDLLPTLVDYELLAGQDGKRTVGFGWFAGVAGALEAFNAMAHAHLELGVASPFLYIPRPHTHSSLESIRKMVREVVCAWIASEGTPASLGPMIVGVTGTGKVAQGMLDLLADLPIKHVKVADLPALVSDPDTDLRKVYVVHALPQDYFHRKSGGAYERAHYYAHPDEYESVFHTEVAPYLTLLLHGAGWAPGFPRLVTNEQLATTLERAAQIGKGRFACVGDVSCDVQGGLEFLPRHSTLSEPFFTARPDTLPPHLPGVTMMAVDILPTALPREASEHFSRVLGPYLRALIRDLKGEHGAKGADAEARKRLEEMGRATVARGGKLQAGHEWLLKPLGAWKAGRSVEAAEDATLADVSDARSPPSVHASGTRKKNVLMLGAGMVAGPAVDALCARGDVRLVVASAVLGDAERLTAQWTDANAVQLDVGEREAVARLVGDADLVISLLPAPFHPAVAEMCVRHRKHMVTASYISPEMRALHDKAVSADVLLLNEIGLDPGIDHCSAISLLNTLRSQQKEVLSFTSFCGGLPAPAYADSPLGYKFSWSPRGVLTAALNSAQFRVMGETVEVHGEDLLKGVLEDVQTCRGLRLEGIPNRDSLPYTRTYGLEDARTVFRGTLRYPGFCSLMDMFKTIGLLESKIAVQLSSWTELPRVALEARLGTPIKDDASMSSALSDVFPSSQIDELLDALRWLSLMPGVRLAGPLVLPPLPGTPLPPLDVFALILAHKLRYEPQERDLVVLSHEIVTRDPSSEPGAEEIHTSSLIAYGDDHASAMARAVGLPLAFAAQQVLDGAVSTRGVQGPMGREIYEPVLRRLEEVGLGVKESSRTVRSGTLKPTVELALWKKFGKTSG